MVLATLSGAPCMEPEVSTQMMTGPFFSSMATSTSSLVRSSLS